MTGDGRLAVLQPSSDMTVSLPVLFPQRENPRLLNCLDSDIPALSTCSNADAFCRMNTMLGNSLDLSGVCTTPTAKCKRDPFHGKSLSKSSRPLVKCTQTNSNLLR